MVLHQEREKSESISVDAEPSENAGDQFSPPLAVVPAITLPDVVKKTDQEEPVRMKELLKNLTEKRPAVIILPLGNVVHDLDRSERVEVHGLYMVVTELGQVPDFLELRDKEADKADFQSQPQNLRIHGV
jgi:hypothetical protein